MKLTSRLLLFEIHFEYSFSLFSNFLFVLTLELGASKDSAYFMFAKQGACATLNYAVDTSVELDNGPLYVIPKSHRKGIKDIGMFVLYWLIALATINNIYLYIYCFLILRILHLFMNSLSSFFSFFFFFDKKKQL